MKNKQRMRWLDCGTDLRRRLVRVALLAFIWTAVVLSASCELLGTQTLFVSSFSPDTASLYPDSTFSFSFNEAVDTLLLEEALSLKDSRGRAVACQLRRMDEEQLELEEPAQWQYLPYQPLEKGEHYMLRISKDLRSVSGKNLERELLRSFMVSSDQERPVLLATVPSSGQMLCTALQELYADAEEPSRAARGALQLEFSVAMDLFSLYQQAVFSPPLSGTWELQDDGRLALFTPFTDWDPCREYTLELEAGLSSAAGLKIAQAEHLYFPASAVAEAPHLLHAYAVAADGIGQRELLRADTTVPFPLESPLNHQWERGDELLLQFSTQVLCATVDARLSSAELRFTRVGIETAAQSLRYRVSDLPQWGSRAAICVDTGYSDPQGNRASEPVQFHLVFDGPASEPPRFIGLRLPMYPGRSSVQEHELLCLSLEDAWSFLPLEDSPEAYPLDTDVQIQAELYFDVAEGAHIDVLSLIEALSLDAGNACLYIRITDIRTAGFFYEEAAGGWEAYERIQMGLSIRNNGSAGVLRISVHSSFHDSNGNYLSASECLPLVR